MLCTLDCLISHIASVCKCVCIGASFHAAFYCTDRHSDCQTDGQRDRQTDRDRATESGKCCFHCFAAHLSYCFRFFCFDFRRIIKYTIVLEICQWNTQNSRFACVILLWSARVSTTSQYSSVLSAVCVIFIFVALRRVRFLFSCINHLLFLCMTFCSCLRWSVTAASWLSLSLFPPGMLGWPGWQAGRYDCVCVWH